MSEQGFTTALTGLANQRRTALLQERQRLQAEENSRAQMVNELSGFNAADITNPHMRAAFEQQIRDVQDYISGAGEYEGQEYDVVSFARNLRNLSNSYNSMKGHNNESVTKGRTSLLTSATTTAEDSRQNEMGGYGTGQRTYSNNSLTTLENADRYHNNYFEPAMQDGKYMYDENGGLMGREVRLDENDKPIITGDGDYLYDDEVKSIYEMHAYGNASNYSGDTIEADLPSIMDIAQSDPAKNRLTFIKSTYDSQDYARIGTNPEDIHRDAVGRLFEDWWTTDSPMAKDWRESILFDTLKRAGQGTFTLSKEDQMKFINGEELSVQGQAELDKIRNYSESIYYNESYSQPQLKGGGGGGSGSGSDQDALFNTSLFRNVNTSTYNPDTRRFDIGEGGAQRDMRGLVNTIEVTGSNVEGLPEGTEGYTIQNIGVNPMNTENPGGMFATIAIEVPATDDDNPLGLDIGENGTVIQYVDVQVGPNMGGLGEEIFNTLGTGDNLVYQNYLVEQRNAALPPDPDEFAAYVETMELIEADKAIVKRSTQGASLYFSALDNIPGYGEGGTLRGDIEERLNDHTAYTGDNEEYKELGLTVSEVAQQEIYDNFTEDRYMDRATGFKRNLKKDFEQVKNILPNPVEDAKRRKTGAEAASRREEVAEERRQEGRDERREEEDRAEELKNRRISRREETRALQDELGYQDTETSGVDSETGEAIYGFGGPEAEEEIFELLISNPIDSRAGRYFNELQRRADGDKPREVTYEDGVLTIKGEEFGIGYEVKDRSGTRNQQALVDQLEDWEVDLRKQGGGVAVLAKNFGNLRPNSANPYGSGVYQVTAKNKYQTFDSYTNGLKGLIWDVKSKQGLGGLKSRVTDEDTTVLEGMKIWAPAADSNNPTSYADKVVKFINKNSDGEEYKTTDKFSALPTHLLVEAIIMVEDIRLYNKLKGEGFFDENIVDLSKKITRKNIV